jgi:transposase
MIRRDEWAECIEDWKRSGLSAADYGKRHSIAPKKLYWWSWFLRARTKRTTKASGARPAVVPRLQSAMLPVKVRALPPVREVTAEASSIEVALPSGAVIRTTSAVDPTWLGRLVVSGTTPC